MLCNQLYFPKVGGSTVKYKLKTIISKNILVSCTQSFRQFYSVNSHLHYHHANIRLISKKIKRLAFQNELFAKFLQKVDWVNAYA